MYNHMYNINNQLYQTSHNILYYNIVRMFIILNYNKGIYLFNYNLSNQYWYYLYKQSMLHRIININKKLNSILYYNFVRMFIILNYNKDIILFSYNLNNQYQYYLYNQSMLHRIINIDKNLNSILFYNFVCMFTILN